MLKLLALTVVSVLVLGCDSGAARNNLSRCTDDLEQATSQTEQAMKVAEQAVEVAKQFDAQLDYAAKKYHFNRKDLP